MERQLKQAEKGGGKLFLGAGISALAVTSLVVVGPSIAEGFRDGVASFEQVDEAQTTERGRAEVVAVDLDIDARPMVGFVSTVADRQVSLTGKVTANVLGANIDVNTGTKTVDWTGGVATTYEYDPAQVAASYDAGYTDTETDDRFIINVPLDAISARAELLPMSEPIFHNGAWDWANPFSVTKDRLDDVQDAFSDVEGLPVIGKATTAADRDRANVLSVAQVGAMDDVVSECANLLATEPKVHEAFRANIAEDAGNAMRSIDDPVFRQLSVAAMQDMDVVVLIGDEVLTPDGPSLSDQQFDFASDYSEALERVYNGTEDDNYTFKVEQSGEFTCEISDEVQEQIASSTPSQGTRPGVSNE